MPRLIYLPQATRELVEIRRYIAARSGSRTVAAKYIGKLRAQCRKLSKLPGTMGSSCPEIRKGLRSFPFGNYITLFQYKDDRFEVVSIVERHRDIAALFDKSP